MALQRTDATHTGAYRRVDRYTVNTLGHGVEAAVIGSAPAPRQRRHHRVQRQLLQEA
jgi:hypothetical protein